MNNRKRLHSWSTTPLRAANDTWLHLLGVSKTTLEHGTSQSDITLVVVKRFLHTLLLGNDGVQHLRVIIVFVEGKRLMTQAR
jgi:hypothetical protein